MTTLLTAIAFLVATGTAAVAIAFRGFVVSTLWQWFVVIRFGAPPMSVLHAVGIVYLVGAVQLPITLRKEEKLDVKESSFLLLNDAFIRPSIHLGIGYLVSIVI